MVKRITVIVCLLCLCSGCNLLRRVPKIKIGGAEVTGPKDAGTQATLATLNAGETIALKAGSRVTITRYKAVPGSPAANGAPAVAPQPEREVTEISPAADTQWQRTEARVQAGTGTVDTSLRQHEIDVQDRAKLLWVAIGCGIAGLVVRSMMPAWPSLSNGLLVASPLAFAAWKFAEVPPWLWLCVLIGAGLMIAGYKRAEWDKNGDGIPDAFQNLNGPQKPNP